MASFARWCYRHRLVVLIAWLVVLATVIGVDRIVGNAYSNTFDLPGTESTKALDLLSASLPKQSGDSDSLVWHVSSGTVNDPTVRTRMTALMQLIAKAPSVAGVTSPYTPRGAVQISRDGKTAYATVAFTKLAAADSRPIEKIAVPSATTAVMSGSAMPSSEPKAMRMMMAAAMRPMTSLSEGGV